MATAQRVTFTAASTDVDDATELNSQPGDLSGSGAMTGPIVYQVTATGNNAAGSATVEFLLTDGTTVFQRRRLTIQHPATAKRTDNAGTGGNYIMDVVDERSGNDFVDLAGPSRIQGATTAALVWKVGCSVLTTITSLTVDITPKYAH